MSFAWRGARRAGYLGAALIRGGPGLAFHARVVATCARLLASPRGSSARTLALHALTFPMEAVRYFEFGTAWSWVAELAGPIHFLDVSSPRLFPLLLLRSRPGARAVLLNPDRRDLATTHEWVDALGLGARCSLHPTTLADAAVPAGAFDLVTSISVLEHIPAPDDLAALERMWESIRPGGRLILTAPCAAEAFEEHVDLNEYGLLAPDEHGFVFGQRFYDLALLQERVFARCGMPRRMAVLGERRAGTAFADREAKLLGRVDPTREPYAAARDYAPFPTIESLPGVGVVALEFEKHTPA